MTRHSKLHTVLPALAIGLALMLPVALAAQDAAPPPPHTPDSPAPVPPNPDAVAPAPVKPSPVSPAPPTDPATPNDPAVTAPVAPGGKLELPVGTRLPLVLHNGITTRIAKPGDPVYLETLFPVIVDGKIMVPAGSYVSGEVTEAKRAGRVKGRAEINLRLKVLILPNGYIVNFAGAPAGAGTGGGETMDNEGKIKGDSDKASDAGTLAKTTAAGAGIGADRGGRQGAGHWRRHWRRARSGCGSPIARPRCATPPRYHTRRGPRPSHLFGCRQDSIYRPGPCLHAPGPRQS
jgi:hypothetical protein